MMIAAGSWAMGSSHFWVGDSLKWLVARIERSDIRDLPIAVTRLSRMSLALHPGYKGPLLMPLLRWRLRRQQAALAHVVDLACRLKRRQAELHDLLGDDVGSLQRRRVLARQRDSTHARARRARVEQVDANIGRDGFRRIGVGQRVERSLRHRV